MGLWLVGLLHLAIVLGAFRQAGDLLSLPIRNDDSAIHFYTAVHARDHLRNAGTLWGYDPGWMAGYPGGSLGLVDNKLFSLIVGLAPEGWEAAAYNAGFLLVLLSPPWLLYLAARTGGASSAAATGAALAACGATFSIPLVVGFLLWGGVSFFLSSVLTVPATLVLARAIAAGSLPSARGLGALLIVCFMLLVHPAMMPVLGAGLLPAFAFAAGAGRRAGLALDAALTGVAVFIPVFPVVEGFVELRRSLRPDPGARFMHGGLEQLRDDWWTHLFEIDWLPHGAGGLLGLCLLAAVGAAVDLARAPGRARRLARWVVLTAAGSSALVAYVASSIFPRVAGLQPYRFILPMAFFLCLPAGEALAEIPRGRSVPRLLALAALAIMLSAGLGLAPILAFGVGSDPAEDRLIEILEREGDGGGRTLVESHFQSFPAAPGAEREIRFKRFAFLPLRTSGEFLGHTAPGLITVHQYARFTEGKLFGRALSELGDEELDGLLRRYAVTRVVACTPQALRTFHRLRSVVEQREAVGDCWLFAVRQPDASRLLEGRGEARAFLDRIEVRGAEGARIVLKYHWMPSLVTEPPLPIEEAAEPGQAVGFIAVRPGSRRDFNVVHRRTRTIGDVIAEAIRALAD